MAFTEFYCDPNTGSNLNGGSDAGSPSMSDTGGTGSWTSTTQIYITTVTTGTVTVGQFLSIYTTSATIPSTIARIITVSGGSGTPWTITVSNTAYSGTQPSALTTGTTYNAICGGAWQGPNGTVGFPFNFITNAATDSGGDTTRVNFKNDASYSITASMTHNNSGPITFSGYTSSPGDGGMATFQGPTSGASFTLLILTSARCVFQYLTFIDNGATGSVAGCTASSNETIFYNCVATGMRGAGFTASASIFYIECEAYGNNTSNTNTIGGFLATAANCLYIRCISHNNTGTNNIGFVHAGGFYLECIADSNGSTGGWSGSSTNGSPICKNCVSYNNVGPGIYSAGTGGGDVGYMENCILVNNGTYGIQIGNSGGNQTILNNCAFYGNTSGPVSGTTNVVNNNPITLTGNPFVSASTGNFTLNTISGEGAACRAAGIGFFLQTASGYTGTIGYPDVGAAKSLGSSGGFIISG